MQRCFLTYSSCRRCRNSLCNCRIPRSCRFHLEHIKNKIKYNSAGSYFPLQTLYKILVADTAITGDHLLFEQSQGSIFFFSDDVEVSSCEGVFSSISVESVLWLSAKEQLFYTLQGTTEPGAKTRLSRCKRTRSRWLQRGLCTRPDG